MITIIDYGVGNLFSLSSSLRFLGLENRISGKKEGDSYRIWITDNGRGIPPEELGRITEAFYMVDKSRARKQHGAGLGMTLVSKIVEIHGAGMKIESDGKTGTRICLDFVQGEERDDGKI